MKRVRKFFRRLLCRHNLSVLAEQNEDDLCLYVLCLKCGKISGHFHVPIATKAKETRH